MSQDNNKTASYLNVRPKVFDPESILFYIDLMDKKAIDNEIAFDEAKDLVEVVLAYVVNEKMTNEKLSLGLAKVKATNDDRYKKVKQDLSNRKKLHLFSRAEAKNAHSYCDSLKQKAINEIATEKLLKH